MEHYWQGVLLNNSLMCCSECYGCHRNYTIIKHEEFLSIENTSRPLFISHVFVTEQLFFDRHPPRKLFQPVRPIIAESMDDSQSSRSDEEPFLVKHPAKMHRQHAWSQNLVVVIWLTGHIIMFTILGLTLVLIIQHAILNATFSKSSTASPEQNTEFGGLPVHHDDPNGLYVICPSTGGPSTALQAGCKFDLFANGWTPGPCFDAEKHDWFVNQRDYYFWLDKDKNHRVHQEELLKGTLEYPEVFVSFEEHYEHCRYLLNGTQRYAHDPTLGVLDIHMDMGHMNHCIDILGESRDPLTLETEVIAYFGYRKCFLPHSDIASGA